LEGVKKFESVILSPPLFAGEESLPLFFLELTNCGDPSLRSG
jgi:hypothetical protein